MEKKKWNVSKTFR